MKEKDAINKLKLKTFKSSLDETISILQKYVPTTKTTGMRLTEI